MHDIVKSALSCCTCRACNRLQCSGNLSPSCFRMCSCSCCMQYDTATTRIAACLSYSFSPVYVCVCLSMTVWNCVRFSVCWSCAAAAAGIDIFLFSSRCRRRSVSACESPFYHFPLALVIERRTEFLIPTSPFLFLHLLCTHVAKHTPTHRHTHPLRNPPENIIPPASS